MLLAFEEKRHQCEYILAVLLCSFKVKKNKRNFSFLRLTPIVVNCHLFIYFPFLFMQNEQSRYVDEKPRIELPDLCDLKSQINDQKYDIGSCTTVITCAIFFLNK